MNKPKSAVVPNIINFFLFALIFICRYSGLLSLKIYGIAPLTPLALLVAVSMFSGEWTAAFAGLITGIFMDSVSSNSSVLYTVTMFITALSVSLIIHYYFNNNIRSAIALCAIFCAFVFLARWIFFFCIGTTTAESLGYLMRIALPSALYTLVFIIPFYYLERRLYRGVGTN